MDAPVPPSRLLESLSGGDRVPRAVMQPGQKTTFTFSTPGTYHYQCHIHPHDMQGSVTVTS